MGRRLIEVMQVLVDQIHQGGYQHRVLEDSIYEESQKRIAAEKDRDHWRQARDTAIEGGELLLKSNQTLQAEIETLRQELANAQRELSEQSMVANVETQQDAAAWQQQVDSANAEIANLRQELAEAQQERVDAIDDYKNQIAAAEALIDPEANGETTIAGMADMILHLRRQLYAGTEPTPVAETAPCRECERLRAEIERLLAFVYKVRAARDYYKWSKSWHRVETALAELDAEGGK